MISLYDDGADFSEVDKLGNTILHKAAEKNHDSIIRFILGNGSVNTKVQNKVGFTALHLATKYGSRRAVALLAKVSDINATNSKERLR